MRRATRRWRCVRADSPSTPRRWARCARPIASSGATGRSRSRIGMRSRRGSPPKGRDARRDEALHDAILERVEAHDREPAAGGEPRDGARQRAFELAHLVVHRDPKGLERARGRILTPITPRARADGLGHDLSEPPGRVDGALRASRNNRSCNRLSKPFFTMVAEDLRQFGGGGTGDEVGGRFADVGIHPHVERTVVPERESAPRVVDLRRGDAEVEQHAVDGVERERVEHGVERREARAAEGEAGIVDRARVAPRRPGRGRSRRGDRRARAARGSRANARRGRRCSRGRARRARGPAPRPTLRAGR